MTLSKNNNRRGLRTSLIAGVVAALGIGSSALACEPADFDMSGSVGLEDLQGFLGAFLAGEKTADINLDGRVSVQDLFDFIFYWVPSYSAAATASNGSPKPIDPIETDTLDQSEVETVKGGDIAGL